MGVPKRTLRWSPTTQPGQTPVWVDLSSRLRWWELDRGKQNEFDQVETGRVRLGIANEDRYLDPFFEASPAFPNVKPVKRFQLLLGENGISNPSFETNTSGWSANGAGATITRITSDAKYGSACLRIAGGTAGTSQALQNVSSPVLAQGTKYTVSGWLKAENAGAVGETGRVLLWETGGAQAAQTVAQVAKALTSEWVFFQASGRINQADRTGLQVYVGVSGGVESGDQILADGIQLVIGDPQPYFDAPVALLSGYMQDLPRRRLSNSWAEVEVFVVDGFEPLAHAPLVGSRSAELTGARIGWALDQAGHPAADRAIDAGQTTVPAATFAAEDNQKALTHIQDVAVDAEIGLFYMRGDGFAIFKDRASLLKPPYTDSQATFSDKPTGSELPYADIVGVTEARKIINDWTVSRDGGTPQQVIDTTSQDEYFPRADAKTVLLTSDSECLSQGQYRISRTKDPLQRFESVTLRPGDSDDLWRQVVLRDLGERVTLKENPPGGGAANEEEVHIQHISIRCGRSLRDLTCEWHVHSGALKYWLLGTTDYSELGETTKLGPY